MLVNTEVSVRGLQLGWQMETLLYSSLTVAHLEREARLEIRCIPDMHGSPCLPLGKTFAGSCCALQLRPCSLSPFPAKLSEWKMEPLIIPFPRPHPLPPLPSTALLKAFRGHPGTVHFQSSDSFSIFILLTFPQHLKLSVTISLLLESVILSCVNPLVPSVVSTMALKYGLWASGFVPLLFFSSTLSLSDIS